MVGEWELVRGSRAKLRDVATPRFVCDYIKVAAPPLDPAGIARLPSLSLAPASARLRSAAGFRSHGVWNRATSISRYPHINPHITMNAPSTALLRTFSPLWRSATPLATVRGCLAQQQQRADFSSTPANQARDKRNKKDPKIGMHCEGFASVANMGGLHANNAGCSANPIPLAAPPHASTSPFLPVREHHFISAAILPGH
jgi:hypothetical protein